MKVILLKDVPKLGSTGSIQEVAPGYARNYLIPQGFAAAATKGSIKQAEERIAAEQRRIAKQEDALRGLSERIQGMRLVMEARVGEAGRLYGSITADAIAERLSAELGEEIDDRKIGLEHPIRTIGDHEVTVRLVGRLTPTITVTVADPDAPESAEEQEPAAEAMPSDESLVEQAE
jgi:large subunit ribosomal protein L9